MKIAIPLANDKLSQHFGHCQQFAVIDVDIISRTITDQQMHTPPAHEPGVLPAWLAGMNVNVIIAGGMGQRAQQLFSQNNIEVVTGAPVDSPENLVTAYITDTLQVGTNTCDH